MHRTESDNKITVGGKNLFTNGPPGTTRDAVDVNTTQEEIAYVIEQAGLTLKTVATETNQQLKEAIDAIILAGSPNSPVVDFESKNLIINVQSNTTVDADADRLSFLNSSNIPIYENDIDETFDITTDLMAGTAEKASTWYQLWRDSAGVRMMVPDLTGSDDGADDNKLIDSAADFVTEQVQVGDIVYNLTDLSQAVVSAVDNLTTLSLTAVTPGFVMQNGDEYKIRMLSPTGLGTSKSRIGAAYNNAASNLDDSYYTQIQERRTYTAAKGDAPAVTGGAGFTIAHFEITPWQDIDGGWHVKGIGAFGQTSDTICDITVAGISSAIARSPVVLQNWGIGGYVAVAAVDLNGGIFLLRMSAATDKFGIVFDIPLNKKPTFHN